jgi:exo-beta-1,3-glucanase (GH17 family)
MCNTTALVLQAIKDTKVDMQVYAAIYIDSNEDAYDTQVKAIGDAFATYGVDNVEGVAVGNEFLLIDMTAAGSGDVDPTKSTYLHAVKKLVPYITKFRASLASWNLSKTIKVGTGDAGALMSTALGEYIDYFMANVHPWFAGTTVEDGPAWTYNYFMEADVAPALNSSRQVDTYIAETGWPTGHDPLTKEGSDSRAGGGKDATLANLQSEYGWFTWAIASADVSSLPRQLCLPGQHQRHKVLLL